MGFNNTASGVSMKQDVIIMENIFYDVTPSAVYDLKVQFTIGLKVDLCDT